MRNLRDTWDTNLARTSGAAETMTTEQLKDIGVYIITTPSKKCYIEAKRMYRGMQYSSYYDTRWQRNAVAEEFLFPSYATAQIAVSIKINKGVIL